MFHQDDAEEAIALLARWLAWASRSQLPAFVTRQLSPPLTSVEAPESVMVSDHDPTQPALEQFTERMLTVSSPR